MRILLIGPQGSGKGTQSKLISEKYKIPHISTGDIFRDALLRETELGIKADSFIKKGQLVHDDIVTNLVKERVRQKDCREGFVLDGYPRNINQARALDKITNLDKVFVLKISDDIAIKRLTLRRQCNKCKTIYSYTSLKKKGICSKCKGKLIQRNDDKSTAIKKRLDIYHKETEPLIDYYKKKGIVHIISGNQLVEKIAFEIDSFLQKEKDILEL